MLYHNMSSLIQMFYAVIIFCVVVFIYMHIYFHLKTSDDLEVYDIEQPSKEKLEEICDLRQPVIFRFDPMLNVGRRSYLRDSYGAFDVTLRHTNTLNTTTTANGNETDTSVPIALCSALQIIEQDTKGAYICENNSDFLDETGMVKSFKHNDAYLRPYMVSKCQYDIVMAAKDTKTPLRYELNYRNYFVVTEGSVTFKLFPPKSTKYLYQEPDYETLEFRSPVNVWDVQNHYKPDFEKLKSIDVTLTAGQIVYIPAYWWYSAAFISDNATMCTFKYRTFMNTVAILPHLIKHVLQQQNVKQNNLNTVSNTVPSTPVPLANEH